MAGTWQPLVQQPTFNTSTMMLLTDGRIMVQEEATQHWHALTPDIHGSYVDGTWSTLADMSIWRRYYASGVLRDGRVVIIGGEQSGAGGDTTLGEIYDPVTDTWSPIPSPPGWTMVGDASCCILPDGRLMIGALTTPQCAIFDPVTDTWSAAASKAVRSNEETWVLLPDGTILTAQCFPPYQAEKYIIATNTWQNEGAIPVQLVDPGMAEIGPAMLMYNGKVIYFGAANSGGVGKTAIYTPPASPTLQGTWIAGPDIPKVGGQTIVSNDCPASLLPNGTVLFTGANFVNGNWGQPILFFEYDPVANTITQAPTPPNNNEQLFWSRLMLLPTGQVLFGPSTNNMQVYTATGHPHHSWRPHITSVHRSSAHRYTLHGKQLNGLSQANIYGDDCYPATNYPLVRLRNVHNHHVYFARTSHFSTMAVATGASNQACRFTVGNIPHGEYEIVVIANGIESAPVRLHHRPRRHDEDERFRRDEELVEVNIEVNGRGEAELDPALAELSTQIKLLQNSVRRLNLMTETKGARREPKIAKMEQEEAVAAEKPKVRRMAS
jgi:Kelch motif